MEDLKKFGGFLGAMTAFTPSFMLGGVHYTISLLEGKNNAEASTDFKRTFERLYNLGEHVGAELTEGVVRVGSRIFNGANDSKQDKPR